jgi:hypothetical protein
MISYTGPLKIYGMKLNPSVYNIVAANLIIPYSTSPNTVQLMGWAPIVSAGMVTSYAELSCRVIALF